MTGREDRIGCEALALWRELYGEPPPARAEGRQLLDMILKRMPQARYERLASPYLQRKSLTWPRAAARRGR